jgi:hypothetical protein
MEAKTGAIKTLKTYKDDISISIILCGKHFAFAEEMEGEKIIVRRK